MRGRAPRLPLAGAARRWPALACPGLPWPAVACPPLPVLARLSLPEPGARLLWPGAPHIGGRPPSHRRGDGQCETCPGRRRWPSPPFDLLSPRSDSRRPAACPPARLLACPPPPGDSLAYLSAPFNPPAPAPHALAAAIALSTCPGPHAATTMQLHSSTSSTPAYRAAREPQPWKEPPAD